MIYLYGFLTLIRYLIVCLNIQRKLINRNLQTCLFPVYARQVQNLSYENDDFSHLQIRVIFITKDLLYSLTHANGNSKWPIVEEKWFIC